MEIRKRYGRMAVFDGDRLTKWYDYVVHLPLEKELDFFLVKDGNDWKLFMGRDFKTDYFGIFPAGLQEELVGSLGFLSGNLKEEVYDYLSCLKCLHEKRLSSSRKRKKRA